MDIFDLLGSSRDSTPAGCLATIQRSRKLDWKLHIFHGSLSSALYLELDLPRAYREELSASLGGILLRSLADASLCGLLLLLLCEPSQGRKVHFASSQEVNGFASSENNYVDNEREIKRCIKLSCIRREQVCRRQYSLATVLRPRPCLLHYIMASTTLQYSIYRRRCASDRVILFCCNFIMVFLCSGLINLGPSTCITLCIASAVVGTGFPCACRCFNTRCMSPMV